ncbi:UDPGP type 1 family protein [Puniceicoccaceae bacterium K14]|nr:UDPGP type 1 family protein [Puniceicoccaceae bacterium K14]
MDTKELFEKHGQGHVFKYWDELGSKEQASLLEQAGEIDLGELDELVDTFVKGSEAKEVVDFANLKPAPYEKIPEDLSEDSSWQEAKTKGESALRDGKVAAFTVAGGQGTRLGYNGPKGTFPISPIKSKTLFQLFAEKVGAARVLYGAEIPWFIMTSHVNHDATVSFFEENAYFGLAEGSVKFFKQGRMAAVDFDGKIILEGKGTIAMSPDGHGGALRALERSGAIAEMKSKGIEILSYFQVDNPLVQVIDPYFIGFHIKSGSAMSSKMLPKAYEAEKLGHFCELDGKQIVVEYSDMPEELTALRDEEGKLKFIAGSIAIHIMDVAFIDKIASAESSVQLPFHKAVKKIACLNEGGETVKPSDANGIKFEMFVFDALPFADRALVMETTRLNDFSPVKNAEGVDSPESSRADQQKLYANWLASKGVELEVDESGVPVKNIEIAASFAYSSETFDAKWAESTPDVDIAGEIYIS